MDDHIYSKPTIEKFIQENLFFKDPKMQKYYDRNLQRDLGKFRSRAQSAHKTKNFDKMMYVFVTDSIRDIIINTVGEIGEYMKSMGDVIISGGEAFNLYTDFDDRIITSDIDAKFVPRLPVNPVYFGKLQATKLMLWNKLGEIAQHLNIKIKNRIMSMKKKDPKLFKFLGISFKNSGPFVTRRYTLIKKKKTRNDNKPGKSDVFIDVELFALDLNIRFFSPETGRIQDFTMGGILDIPFMRPKEFGYEVVLSRRRGITYRNLNTGKLVTDNRVYIASKEFLIEDIYLMHKLKLRPEKRKRIVNASSNWRDSSISVSSPRIQSMMCSRVLEEKSSSEPQWWRKMLKFLWTEQRRLIPINTRNSRQNQYKINSLNNSYTVSNLSWRIRISMGTPNHQGTSVSILTISNGRMWKTIHMWKMSTHSERIRLSHSPRIWTSLKPYMGIIPGETNGYQKNYLIKLQPYLLLV